MSEKELLELAISKNVNFRFLKFCFGKRRSLSFYNNTRCEEDRLTYDEFESLKEFIMKGTK